MNVEEKAAIKKRDKIKFIIYSDVAMYLGLSMKLSYQTFLKIELYHHTRSQGGFEGFGRTPPLKTNKHY